MAAGRSLRLGALAATTVGHIDPDMAYWTTSGEFIFITILAGTGSVVAPFAGLNHIAGGNLSALRSVLLTVGHASEHRGDGPHRFRSFRGSHPWHERLAST